MRRRTGSIWLCRLLARNGGGAGSWRAGACRSRLPTSRPHRRRRRADGGGAEEPHQGPRQGPAPDRRQSRVAAGRAGRRARIAARRCARAAITTRASRPRSPTSRSRMPPRSMPSSATPESRQDALRLRRRDRAGLPRHRSRDPGSGRARRLSAASIAASSPSAPGKPADAALILATEDEILGQCAATRLCPGRGRPARSADRPRHARGAGHLRRRARTGGPHGAGPLLRHREGRHHLPAAPRAVRGGRALRRRPR